MPTQSMAADARVLLPQCHCCTAPMRIRTIDVQDRHEQVRFACTACGAETIQSYRLGKDLEHVGLRRIPDRDQ
jgi:predicted SprT family Zn-dependent metalloprotease